jgi:hypothetical protein
MTWLTWKRSAERLKRIIIEGDWFTSFPPSQNRDGLALDISVVSGKKKHRDLPLASAPMLP